MFAEVVGAEDLDRQFAGFPALVSQGLLAKARALAEALAAKVRDEKLSGQTLESRSGALKASIAAEVAQDGDGVTATVGSSGDVKYAAIQEYGGRTSPHEILPDKAKALAFMMGGAPTFARRVAHPGSEIPGRAYLQSSLDESYEDVVAALADVAKQAWDNG